MSRRGVDISKAHRRCTLGDAAAVLLVIAVAGIGVLCLIFWLMTRQAHAHDSWISRGALKNPAGEWCCGAEDCGIVDKDAVHITAGGYNVRGSVIYGEAATGNEADGPTRSEGVNETIPFNQAQPSPDGAYWRCKRPDGSPRCFFAPPPGS